MNRLFSRLLGHGNSRGKMGFMEAQRMVLDYARFLENSTPMPGCIADVSQLPYSKERLKEALALCLANNDDALLAQHLRHGYLMLSAWQEDVGEEVLGTDFAGLDLDADPIDVATLVERNSEITARWSPRISAEQEALRSELRVIEAMAA